MSCCALLVVLCWAQAPGSVVPDTKLDLTADPTGFLGRATHLWSAEAPLGQVQNQAYGYFFPQGAFFLAGDLTGVPAWALQRTWWSVLLCLGLVGVVRLADELGVGSRPARLVAGVAYVLAPRVLTTLGPLSSETLPVVLAPWVLLPVVVGLRRGSPRRAAALSAVAVLGMGAVNAVATGAACLVALVWWAAHRPDARWRAFTAWWVPCVGLACAWWAVPLLLLGRYSPPFLDYIETASVTTRWTSLVEVLRGTDDWVPFVSADWTAGAVLASQPAAVLGTGVVAAAGLVGLARPGMPARGRLVTVLLVGVVALGAGYAGALSGPFAEEVRGALDGALAPVRNVHKIDPLVRLPLALGLAHLLGAVPLPGALPGPAVLRGLARPERRPVVGVGALVLVALVVASSVAWTGRLVPRGAYAQLPDHWVATAQWLADRAPAGGPGDRALVVPGAPLADQVWGTTRDEPLQALASTPWAVRDAVPLVPPGAVRALDSVQRLLAEGRPSAGLAPALAAQGVRYLVVRNDLAPATSRSVRPALVRAAVTGSPGLRLAVEIGPDVGAGELPGVVSDGGLRPRLPAVQVYEVSSAPVGSTGPRVLPLASVPVVQGGPEALLRLRERGLVEGPVLLAGDAPAAGPSVGPLVVTDGPTAREADFGRVDQRLSAVRAPGDPRRTAGPVLDHAVSAQRDTPEVVGEWVAGRLSASSSASDATQPGGARPGESVAAAVDLDDATAWQSRGLQNATGQWLQLDLDTPVERAVLSLTTSGAAGGPPVSRVRIATENGSVLVDLPTPGAAVQVSLPPGPTARVRVTAVATADGSPGRQLGIAELSVSSDGLPVVVQHRLRLPPLPPGAAVAAWDLGPELPGTPACVPLPDQVRCTPGVGLAGEEPVRLARSLDVPSETAAQPSLQVRARPGAALDGELALAAPGVVATGRASVADPRGGAGAAVDGDPGTAWTAVPGDLAPGLLLALPARTVVTGLELDPAVGQLPARVTRVSVDTGAGPVVREVVDGAVVLPPVFTDEVRVVLAAWDEVVSVDPAGVSAVAAPGLSEIRVRGLSVPAAPDALVTLPCERGPVLTVGASVVRTSVTATRAELVSGRAVEATPCTDPLVQLPAGRVQLTVDPGPALTVDGVQLRAAPTTARARGTGAERSVPTSQWDTTLRGVQVPVSDGEQLLVVGETTNEGWVATDAAGRTLTAVTVDGWQQGWVVPPGTAGTVTLRFTPDQLYRDALGTGAGLVLVLLGVALLPVDSAGPRWVRARGRPATGPWRSSVAGGLGLLLAALVLAGPVGLGVAAAALAFPRRARPPARPVALVVGGSAAVAVALLSDAPWRAAGYAGDGPLPQLLALVALVVVGAVAVPGSRRPQRRRAGSSTSA